MPLKPSDGRSGHGPVIVAGPRTAVLVGAGSSPPGVDIDQVAAMMNIEKGHCSLKWKQMNNNNHNNNYTFINNSKWYIAIGLQFRQASWLIIRVGGSKLSASTNVCQLNVSDNVGSVTPSPSAAGGGGSRPLGRALAGVLSGAAANIKSKLTGMTEGASGVVRGTTAGRREIAPSRKSRQVGSRVQCVSNGVHTQPAAAGS